MWVLPSAQEVNTKKNVEVRVNGGGNYDTL